MNICTSSIDALPLSARKNTDFKMENTLKNYVGQNNAAVTINLRRFKNGI